MKSLQNFALVWLAAIALTACVSIPKAENNIERLSQLEIGYRIILEKATLYANEDRLSESQVDRLTGFFDEYEKTHELAVLAVKAGDEGAFDNQAMAITQLFITLRAILSEVEQ